VRVAEDDRSRVVDERPLVVITLEGEGLPASQRNFEEQLAGQGLS